MQRKYLSQAFKHAGDDSVDREADGDDGSGEPTDGDRGRVTDRRRGTGKPRKPEADSGQDDSGQDESGQDKDPDASDPFDLM